MADENMKPMDMGDAERKLREAEERLARARAKRAAAEAGETSPANAAPAPSASAPAATEPAVPPSPEPAAAEAAMPPSPEPDITEPASPESPAAEPAFAELPVEDVSAEEPLPEIGGQSLLDEIEEAAAEGKQEKKKKAKEKEQKEKKQKEKLVGGRMVLAAIRYVAIVICILVVVYEGYEIISSRIEYQKAIDEYASIEDEYVQVSGEKVSGMAGYSIGNDGVLVEEDTETYPELIIDFEKLTEVNDDFIGWLYFPALGISYPMVKENYIDEYLRTTMYKTPLTAGSIFMDLWSDAKFGGMVDFIFGHKMRNKTMFGKLPDLVEDSSPVDNDPYVYIYMRDRVYRYRVFSFCETMKNATVYQNVGADPEKYDTVIDYIEENNVYSSPMAYDLSMRPDLLILSTCSTFGGDARFIVGTIKDHIWSTLSAEEMAKAEQYDTLKDEYVKVTESPDPAEIGIEVDFDALREINGDVTGWLYFPALEMSYPVVREKETDAYVDTSFFGERDSAGTVFTDVESDELFAGRSDFIYGHYLRDGSMFGPIGALALEEENKAMALAENPYFYVVTPEGTNRYKTAGYYEAEAPSASDTHAGEDTVVYSVVNSDEAYDRVADYIKENNLFTMADPDIFEGRPGMLSLSTCSDFGDRSRILLTGVRDDEPSGTGEDGAGEGNTGEAGGGDTEEP
ncbi:MAG: class B sortase [Lachnospiraceae bacterium]|nr:class B sortase [Lachnospiraceae bacterium]